MELNKKGVFYTFAAIALALVVLFSFGAFKPYELKEEADVIGVRIDSINNFIKSIENDMEKGLFIASFRAFASMGQYITNNGVYITNLEQSFNELIIYGTLQGEEPSLMKDSTFTNWTKKMETEAAKIGIITSFKINDVYINQSDPWHISVISNVSFDVEDKKKTSSWNRTKIVRIKVNIERFEDPFYVMNTNGIVTNQIIKSPISNFVVGLDISNLLTHMNNSYYIESTKAPNFLMRLEGDFGNSSTGIESLVNLDELREQGLQTKTKTLVDYLYFGSKIVVSYQIENAQDWFLIDQEHLETYQVEELTI